MPAQDNTLRNTADLMGQAPGQMQQQPPQAPQAAQNAPQSTSGQQSTQPPGSKENDSPLRKRALTAEEQTRKQKMDPIGNLQIMAMELSPMLLSGDAEVKARTAAMLEMIKDKIDLMKAIE